eukprot:CAMPEP_0113507180 /NCGR_PEP_ID=MMETSP0014_2-20120614/36315_1 /TAXON_ID=2857 /ORGANISM="Nitzschia sp." /LENGTH=601 /DNA_ID=CAMNT_0000402747 /DNA_START=99 /DNA_END=1904 /DNA_ORIENTATION=+ /assembly_acc=CAM_ASM_000159
MASTTTSSKQMSTKIRSIIATRTPLIRKICCSFFVLLLLSIPCRTTVAQQQQQQQGQQPEGIDIDALKSPTAVVWSTSRFFLRADHFSYQITTPLASTTTTTPPSTTLPNPNSIVTITNNITSIVTTYSLADAEQIFITGDPGSNNYMTIEVTWFDVYPEPSQATTTAVMETRNVDDQSKDQGQHQQNEDVVVKERRFYGYFESGDDGVTWTMFEARVYDESEEWIAFQPSLDDDDKVEGVREDCFERDELRLVSSSVITEVSATILFKNLKLAVFLPWSNTDAMEYCMEDPSSSEAGSEENNEEDNDPAVTPPLTFNSSSTTSVFWSSPRYVLEASNFEYTIQSQSPHQDTLTQKESESMTGATNIMIDGDPGWNYENIPVPELDYGYMSIEIEWLSSTDGKDRRFFGYFSSNSTHYNMFEARVVNKYTGDWESFENLEGVISGPLGSCFTDESLVMTNQIGSQIRFDNITLAVFLPWQDKDGDEADEPSLPVLEARSSTFPFGSDEYCTELATSRPVSTPSSGENANNTANPNGSEEGSSEIESSVNNSDNIATTTDIGVDDGDPSDGSAINGASSGAFSITHFVSAPGVLMIAFACLL